MARRSSGSTFEHDIAYSPAVVDGDWVLVSGTTGFDYTTMTISAGLSDPRMRIEIEVTARRRG
jgi:enamine deaminase RidA (YjgF/YER057c/UK114 family)